MKRQEISSRPWFSATPTSSKGTAGGLLHRINQQSKEAAVAKALGSSHSPLVRKRTESSEPSATVTQRQSQPDTWTPDKETSQLPQRPENANLLPLEDESGAEDRCFGPLGSLVPDYNDSDSDPGNEK